MSDLYAFVRLQTSRNGSTRRYLTSFADINAAQSHARRQDAKGKQRMREGASPEGNYCWSLAGEGFEAGTDYVRAFKAHKAAHGVTSDGNGALAMHLLVGASPEWVRAAGDVHDPGNPRVSALIREAKAWAECSFGINSVWAVRYDTDETGSGVVDILCSPVRKDGRSKSGTKVKISIDKALKELAARHGAKLSWTALQDSWSAHAQTHLDSSLQRGRANTGRKHLSPEAYKALKAAERAEAEAVAASDAIQRQRGEAEAAGRWVPPDLGAPGLLNGKRWAQDAEAKLRESIRPLQERAKAYEAERRARIESEEAAARREASLRQREAAMARSAVASSAMQQELKLARAALHIAESRLADAKFQIVALEKEAREWTQALPLRDVAAALGLRHIGPKAADFVATDGRRFAIAKMTQWAERAATALRPIQYGARALVAAVLRIAPHEALSWLALHFPLRSIMADEGCALAAQLASIEPDRPPEDKPTGGPAASRF